MLRAYPGLFLLVFVVAGILFGNAVAVSPVILLAAATLSTGLAVTFLLRGRLSLAAALAGSTLGLICAANFSLQLRGLGPNHLGNIVREPVLARVCGEVADWPDLKSNRTEILVSLDSLTLEEPPALTYRGVDGKLLVKVTGATTALQRGDRVSFEARLYPVASSEREGSAYARYLNLRGVFAQAFLPTVLYVQIDRRPGIGFWPFVDYLRTAICGSFQRNLSPTSSSLARGFLIGETRDIPADVYAWFRDSGTLHLLAVSGANVALVLLFALWVMKPFWFTPRTRMLVLLGVIAVFAGISYGDPSVVRASIMAALVLGARLLGRVYDLNNIIATTALAILLVAPTELHDVGFQLSFATAWGLIFVVPRLGEMFGELQGRRWYRWVVMPALASLVAQVVSAPLILYYFNRLPAASLPANLVIVPLVSIGVMGVMALLVLDLIWPLLGLWAGSLVDIWLRWVLGALKFFGGDSTPVWTSSILSRSEWGAPAVFAVYVAMLLAVAANKSRWARRALAIWLAVVVNVGLILSLAAVAQPSQTNLQIEPVYGGVVVLLSNTPGMADEMIITGLAHRPGGSSAALGSVLSSAGIEQIRRVTVLDADYDAFADVLRTARSRGVESLAVHRLLEGSCRDLQARAASTLYSGPVSFFGGRTDSSAQPGLYLGNEGVSLVAPAFRIDVVSGQVPKALPPGSRGSVSVLVVGSNWKPEAGEWVELHRSGYAWIVCAGIEQPTVGPWPDRELDPDAVPPEYLYDLSRSGRFRLSPGR